MPSDGNRQSGNDERLKRFAPTGNRRSFLIGTSATAIGGLAGCLGMLDDDDDEAVTNGDGDDVGMDVLHFQWSWIPEGNTSPLLLALDRGFWAEKGLSVQFNRGYGSSDTAQAVAAGNTDIGYANPGAVMGVNEEGDADLTFIASHMPRPPDAVFWLPDGEFDDVSDMNNSSVAHAPGAIEGITGPIALEEHGVDWDTVEVTETFSLIEALIEGEVESILYWLYNVAGLWYGDDPVEPEALYLGDMVDMYGNGLCVRTDYLEENWDTVKRFLDGFYEGYNYVFEHGFEGAQESVDSLFKYFEEMAIGVGAEEYHQSTVQLMAALMMSEMTEEHGLGYVEESFAENTNAIVNEHILDGELDLEETFRLDDPIVESGDYPIPDFDENAERLQTIEPGGHDNPMHVYPFD